MKRATIEMKSPGYLPGLAFEIEDLLGYFLLLVTRRIYHRSR